VVKRIDDEVGAAALRGVTAARGGGDVASPEASAGADASAGPAARPGIDRGQLATAVRYTLQRLAERAPGRAVEVRVPPYGAVQALEGPRHTRGTPPNVVETDPETWIDLATGAIAFSEALAAGRVHASGARTDLSAHLPLA